MIIVSVACKDKEEATKIGRRLLVKRLAGCVKVAPAVRSMYLWPPSLYALPASHVSQKYLNWLKSELGVV